MRKEDAPTKAELWEQIVKLTDICIDKAWQSGFDAGVRSANEVSVDDDFDINIDDLLGEPDPIAVE